MLPKIKFTGQSAVEFVLIAPILFLFIFGILQLTYMAYVSFAIQKAALAIARTASLGSNNDKASFKTQLAISLLPEVNLSQKTLLTILASECEITTSSDKQRVTAQVHYPMPIWVPLAKNMFGSPLIASVNYNNTSEGKTIKNMFQIFGVKMPDLSFKGVQLAVVWMTYEATTFNESYEL